MSDADLARRLVALRGDLGLEHADEGRGRRGPGARGLERMARNHRCLRLAAVNLVNANAAAGAARLGIDDRSDEASTFASGRGEKFENKVFSDDAKRIWDMYDRAGLPVGGARDIKDMEAEFEFAARRQHSEELLLTAASGQPSPSLVLKPRLTARLAGQDFEIEPDALILDPSGFYRVAEIKSYADRRGYTSQHKTGSAARQAAVAVVALQQLLTRNDLPVSMVANTADLIFSNSGSDSPTLNRLDITGEVQNIAAVVSEADVAAQQILELCGDRTLDNPDVIADLPPNLCDDCATHCPMWEFCRTEAVQQRHPVILGDHANETIGRIGNVDEILAAVDGDLAVTDPDQIAVLAGLRAATDAYQHALSGGPNPYAELLIADEDDEAETEEDAMPLFAADEDDDTPEERLEIIR